MLKTKSLVFLFYFRTQVLQFQSKVLGTLDKFPTGVVIFKWEAIIQFSEDPSPSPQSNVGIASLLWMNQHQHCVWDGGGGCQKDHTPVWKVQSVPICLTRIVYGFILFLLVLKAILN